KNRLYLFLSLLPRSPHSFFLSLTATTPISRRVSDEASPAVVERRHYLMSKQHRSSSRPPKFHGQRTFQTPMMSKNAARQKPSSAPILAVSRPNLRLLRFFSTRGTLWYGIYILIQYCSD
ncbi:hypothetical protein TorRG33x02_050150, partial [Trema orientale]